MKQALIISAVLFASLSYFINDYRRAEVQYDLFSAVEKGTSKELIIQSFGVPFENIKHFDYMYWGESESSVKNKGDCLVGISYETLDFVFHPQRYLFCFDESNKVVSKVVLRSGVNRFRNIIEAIGFEPS